MTIPFRVKKLTKTAKAPTQENAGDLWDLYADDFCFKNIQNIKECDEFEGHIKYNKELLKSEDGIEQFGVISCDYAWQEKNSIKLFSKSRILVKTGISLELPKEYFDTFNKIKKWSYEPIKRKKGVVQCDNDKFFYPSQVETNENEDVLSYAVADIRPRSGLALKHGITVLNSPGTIDNSYRKEIGVILHNAGHEPYTITKGDKIAQMLIRPLYPSKMEIVEHIEDTGRGGYGLTGK